MDQPTVLIVDDDDGNRELLCDVLGGEPYRLLEAADGQQALDIAEKELPDLILLDVLMPGMGGLGTLHKLKVSGTTRHIPVIMVTALNLDSQISLCLDTGAIDHIVKPFSGLVVRSRVRAALRNHPSASAENQALKRGNVIGFLGAKGGVGTTSTALNVALALVASERSAVVVEMRPCMGTMARQLGVAATLNLDPLLASQSLGDVNARTLSKCLTSHPTGLRLLLAQTGFDDRREIAAQQAEEILRVLSGIAEHVIVDFPCPPTRMLRAGLHCCNFVVLAVELETTCLASAQAMLEGLNAWGIGGDSVGAVLLDHRAGGSAMTVGHARAHLNCRVIGAIPPEPDLSSAELTSGQPVMLSHPESAAAVALTELATGLMADQVPALAVR
jgi:CheY-like chemotaxis protein/MinD-like ATPase involved in chromosome partitioning or flagellar assembly